jgi:predicted PurR-regulated permease PerM
MPEIILKKKSRIILWLILAAVLIYLIYILADIIILLSISILLAFIFEPLVTILEKEGLNRLTSTLLIFAGLGFLVYFGISYLIPNLVIQMNQVITTLHVETLHKQILALENEIYKYLPFFSLGQLSKRIEEFISSGIVNSFDKLSTVLTSIISIITLLVIVPFITFFLLKDSKVILHSILQKMPNKYFEMSYWIFKNITIQLGRFVRGWVFDATFVGIACGFGYYFIGIKNALPLGLISGLGHLVPYFGPIIGGVPAIIISVIQYGNFSHVPFIVILMLIVYALDNGFVQPFVFAKSVDMHPIAIILLILIGSQLFGVIGMLLVIPFATVVRTAAKEIYYALKNYKIAKL